MKEQSHKDEMSAAIRGDFQRLRERGVSATLAPHEAATATMPDTVSVEAAPEEAAETPFAMAEDVSTAKDLDEVPGGAEEEEEEKAPPAPGPGWLSRLMGR